jgi:transcriptional regulator with XRE-family HTH domain
MSETIGTRLKQAREERRMTISQVAEATRIRSHYLEALERDDLSSIPSVAQARGFLRIYSDFLGLKPDALLADSRPLELVPTIETATPSLDLQAAPPQTPPTSRPAHTNILTSLRDRFTRRVASVSAQPEIPAAEIAQPPVTESEPFVPIRYTEELPAAPEPIIEDQSAEKIIKPATKSSKRKAASGSSKTKPVSRVKSAKGKTISSNFGDSQTEVKKKIARSLPKK